MLSKKGYRAAQKFKLKFGFDSHAMADGLSLALNEDDLAKLLHVQPDILHQFLLRHPK